jgi:hypothetical protein
MIRKIIFSVALWTSFYASGPRIMAQSQSAKSTPLTVIKTKGSVKMSKDGSKSILTIDLQKKGEDSKSYKADGDFEVVTSGAVHETVVDGQRIIEVSEPQWTKEQLLSNDCSGPCCLAGDDTIGYQCLHGASCSPKACRLTNSPGNRYCSCK